MSDAQVHEHFYSFKGTYYTVETYPTVYTGARGRFLVDVFLCTGCLQEIVRNQRSFGTTYDDAKGVLPK